MAERRPDPPPRAAPVRALAAVATALAVSVVLPAWLGLPSPVHVAFDAAGRTLGVPAVFNAVHALPFGADRAAKPALFGGLVGVTLLGAWGVARRAPSWAARWGRGRVAGGVAAAAVGGVGLGLFPWADAGPFGLAPSNVAWSPVPVHGVAAVGAFLLAWVATGGASDGARRRGARSGGPSRAGRRGALGWIVGVASSVAAGAGGPAAWAQSAFLASVVPWARIRGLAPRITPADAHYEISKNLAPPRVEGAGWRLRIDGLVTTPLSLRADDLAALPSVTRPTTLVCVSNRVGGDLVGTSEWTGVRLRDLLEAAGVHPDAREVVAWAADNYDDSFPLEAAMTEGTLIAYRHGGAELAPEHGFPARLLVPGIYGMKSVKWLRRIELRAEDHLGYWATRGWSDVATVRTLSRIDSDVATDVGDGRWAVGGVAFAGLRGVARVEVSFDGGATWREANLEAAPSPYAWRRWAWVGTPDAVPLAADGTFDVSVRATDGRGVVQTAERARPLPAGATGWHRRRVRRPDA